MTIMQNTEMAAPLASVVFSLEFIYDVRSFKRYAKINKLEYWNKDNKFWSNNNDKLLNCCNLYGDRL